MPQNMVLEPILEDTHHPEMNFDPVEWAYDHQM